MELKKYIKQKNYLTHILIVTFILLLIPTVARYIQDAPILPGDESYYDIYVATQNKEFFTADLPHDNLIVPYKPVITTPYHKMLGFLNGYVSIGWLSFILAMILGLLSVFLFNRILKRFKIVYFQRFAILMILILSPLFLRTFLIPDQTYFIIFLQLLGFYLFSSRKINYLRYLAAIPYLILSSFGIIHTIIGVVLILGYDTYVNKKWKYALLLGAASTLLSLYYYLPVYYKFGFIKTQIISSNILQTYITDLGSTQGFGIFALILGVFGIIKTWQDKYTRRYILVYLLLILLFVFSFVYHQYVSYLNFIVMIFAGLGFLFLFEMKWELKLIKQITVLIIILGIVFSGVSFIKRTAMLEPNAEFISALSNVRKQVPQDEIILTHPSYGNIVKYYTERKVLIDSKSKFIDDYDYYLSLVDTLFQSRSLKKVEELLQRYNINYILITKEMKNGLTWEKDEQGKLFLLENSNKFKRIFVNPNVELWRYEKTK